MAKRRITQKDRAAWSKNARKGTRKWSSESHKTRVTQRRSHGHKWGFSGKSPKTRKRRYK